LSAEGIGLKKQGGYSLLILFLMVLIMGLLRLLGIALVLFGLE